MVAPTREPHAPVQKSEQEPAVDQPEKSTEASTVEAKRGLLNKLQEAYQALTQSNASLGERLAGLRKALSGMNVEPATVAEAGKDDSGELSALAREYQALQTLATENLPEEPAALKDKYVQIVQQYESVQDQTRAANHDEAIDMRAYATARNVRTALAELKLALDKSDNGSSLLEAEHELGQVSDAETARRMLHVWDMNKINDFIRARIAGGKIEGMDATIVAKWNRNIDADPDEQLAVRIMQLGPDTNQAGIQEILTQVQQFKTDVINEQTRTAEAYQQRRQDDARAARRGERIETTRVRQEAGAYVRSGDAFFKGPEEYREKPQTPSEKMEKENRRRDAAEKEIAAKRAGKTTTSDGRRETEDERDYRQLAS